jgi:hypoxanthine phosphoribosyltransferase
MLTEEAIAQRVAELAQQISTDFAGCELVLLATLKGAVVFLADLMRKLDLPICLEFVGASSYGRSAESSGHVKLNLAGCGCLRDRHVLVVEDIVDTGRTLSALVETIRAAGPASVAAVCLLDKPCRRRVDFVPGYIGFEIPDHFVVGYGLDYAEHYRNLPFVAVLKPDVYRGDVCEP